MSSSVGTTQASVIQMDYMKLLVAQLQNQNPLEPLDNQEMASQLAQFSQLQQLESMNSSFARVLTSVEREYASALIGKEVSFPVVADDGTAEAHSGTVEQVYHNNDGDILLAVGQYIVGLDDILSVKN
jgi:flagellar basal-body rod modification protein FlgD